MIQALIDSTTCNGCGLCETMCPEVFTLNGATAAPIVDQVPEEVEIACRETAESCPFEAITIEEEELSAT